MGWSGHVGLGCVMSGQGRVGSIRVVGFSLFLAFVHWFVAGGVGWCFEGWVVLFGGYYSTDLGCFSRDFGEFLDWVGCSSRGDVVRVVMRVVSNAGDESNDVVASALLGKWLFCDRFRRD